MTSPLVFLVGRFLLLRSRYNQRTLNSTDRHLCVYMLVNSIDYPFTFVPLGFFLQAFHFPQTFRYFFSFFIDTFFVFFFCFVLFCLFVFFLLYYTRWPPSETIWLCPYPIYNESYSGKKIRNVVRILADKCGQLVGDFSHLCGTYFIYIYMQVVLFFFFRRFYGGMNLKWDYKDVI